MSFITPVAARVKADLEARFPGIKTQTYNRRKISGSTVWSQHSWPNALDIFFTAIGDTSGAHMDMLDEVYRWLRYNVPEARNILWRRTAHYDHIHIDFWPKGYGIPSTTRGGSDNLYMQRDGTVITQLELEEGEDALAILSDKEQLELQKFLQFINEMGSNVSFVKPTIQLIRDHRSGGPLAPQPPLDLDDYEIIIQRKEV